ncbi:hypothetical protein ACFVAQ_16675 [Streptomyces sp. NPDC057651]
MSEWHDAVPSGQEWENLRHAYAEAMNALGDPYADYMEIAAATLGTPSAT